MINFELNTSDFIGFKELNILSVMDSYTANILSDDIKTLIEYFNKEYMWDGMFNYNDVVDRLDKKHYLFILYYGHQPIGYIFYEPKSENEIYLYNLYVTNCIKRPSYSPIWFVNNTIKLLPKSFTKISCVCEDWHSSAHNVFKSNGFLQK